MRTRDKMNNAEPAQVAKAAFAVLDRLQNYPTHLQPMAAAAVFLVLSERLKLSAQDAFTVTKNLMNSKEGLRPHFVALVEYAKNELKD